VGAAIVESVPGRQDQLQSHQFATQRVVAALLAHDPDPARSPFRRTAGATFAGILLAVVALAGAAVYGLFTGPGPESWRDPTAILVEKESGARYVFSPADGTLHPVPNYASALLLVNSPDAHVVLVSRTALASAPLGARLGIPDAPDSLPPPAALRSGPWTLCSVGGRGVLLVGVPVPGGRPLAPPLAGSVGEGLLLSTVDGDGYLVHAGRRYRIPRPETALAALGWSGRQPVRAAPELVNALPAGPDLRALDVPDRGHPSPATAGAKVGQVYTTGGHQYAVALDDGAYDLTDVQAALLLADPASPPPVPLSTAQYAALHRGSRPPAALPATVPTLVTPATSVCTVDGRVLLDATVPAAGPVVVPRGGGALVEAVAAPGAPPGSGTVSVVTDTGLRYPLASPDLLAALGYRGVTPVRVPAALVALVPSGPALDPAAARTAAGS
jgi:type VII secretion protein EccB